MFDLGNILVKLNEVTSLWPDRQPELGSLSFSDRWSVSQAVHDYETGRIDNLDQFYQSACQEMGITVSEDQFRKVFIEVIGDLFDETIPLLTALKPHYRLALLSNTSPDHWLHCRDELGLGCFFDDIFVSYELGTMKPDQRIYEQVLVHLKVDPKTIWFFDDREVNAKGASKLGIHAVHSFGGDRLIEDLRKLNFIEG
jgi:putative hydrolase of the HAD superfamily